VALLELLPPLAPPLPVSVPAPARGVAGPPIIRNSGMVKKLCRCQNQAFIVSLGTFLSVNVCTEEIVVGTVATTTRLACLNRLPEKQPHTHAGHSEKSNSFKAMSGVTGRGLLQSYSHQFKDDRRGRDGTSLSLLLKRR
jgi:hypothetical protein